MLPLEKSASASHGLCGNRVSISGDNALLIGGIVAVARQFHQQIEPARAVLVVGVGQRLHLRRSQPLQLQLAGGLGHGKAVAGRGIEARLARQNAILLGCLGVAPGVVVGIAQAAQLGHRQCRLGAHLRQLGARRLRLRAQGMRQQDVLESRFRRLLLAERELHLALCQLKAGPVRSSSVLGRRQHLRAPAVSLFIASSTLASSSGAWASKMLSG